MKKRKRASGMFIATMFLLTVMPFTGHANVPQEINYQGYLTDSGGNPVPDGDYVVSFAIYNLITGGIPLWSEAQTVTVANGIYNVILGQNPFPPDLFDGDLYLGITVEADTEMTPRQKITSTAFAMKAEKADDAETLDQMDSIEFAASTHGHSFSELTGTASDPQIPNNITINYAANAGSAMSAGNADTVDNKHASDFAASSHSHDGSAIDSGTIADARIAVSIARDSEIMPTVLGSDGPGSELNADYLDGLSSGSFLSTASDYGRSGVSSTLYEGTTSLTNKYVNQSGDTMVALSTGDVLAVANAYTGFAIYGTNSAHNNYGHIGGASYGVEAIASRDSSIGVYGKATGADGKGVFGEATGANSVGVFGKGSPWAGYFSGNMYASGNLGIGTTDPQEKLHVEGDIRIPNNSSITNANDRAVFHTGWTGAFGNYSVITSGYEWGGSYPPAISVVAGTNGVFFTKGDSTGALHTETLVKVNTSGQLTCNVLEIKGGIDIAEPFEIQKPEDIKAGTVMAIDPDNPGKLKISDRAYNRKVAGIVSGAGGVNPGILMTQKGSTAHGTIPIALTGRVYCLAEASGGSIEPGDLLTTSDTPGHAMKATDRDKSFGSVIGKAMTGLAKDKGLVLVLVTLQ
jgi:hypothetical protein